MTDRVWRPYSPTRTAGPRVSVRKDEVEGMVAALNQGAIALDLEPDWVLQSSEVTWTEEE